MSIELIGLTIVVLGTMLGIYILPSIIVISHHKKQKGAIIALNLLTGWTGIGWVVSFIWSLYKEKEGV